MIGEQIETLFVKEKYNNELNGTMLLNLGENLFYSAPLTYMSSRLVHAGSQGDSS